MKMFKLEVYVIDRDYMGLESICTYIEQCSDYYFINIMDNIEEADIGEFEDDHPLNYTTATVEQFRRYFNK